MNEVTSKLCRMCGQEKPASAFHKAKQNADGLQSYCRECSNKHNRELRRKKKAMQKKKAIGAPVHREEKNRPEKRAASVISAPVHREKAAAPLPASPSPPRVKNTRYPGWRRHGFIIRPEYVERLKGLAAYRRQDITQLLDDILSAYFAGIK